MKLLDFFEITEAKFKKPDIMYHGTSSKHLQSILKNGVLPNPKDKVWGDINDGDYLNTFSFSRASLQGSYWTNNLMTSISSAGQAKRSIGSDYSKLIIVAQIAKQSAFSDEDNYMSILFRAMADTYQKVYNRKSPLTGEATMKSIALSYFTDLDKGREQVGKQQWVETFGKLLHEYISENPARQPINWSLMKDLFETILLRTLIHEKKNSSKWMKDKWVEAYESIHGEITITPTEIEYQLHEIREKLTRVYRGGARSNNFMASSRITEPVTFRGSNRILMVVEIRQSDTITGSVRTKTFLIGHYVHKIPQLFLIDWQKSMGPLPVIVAPNMKDYIYKPEEMQA